jgi:hypothetical protein
MDIRLSIFVNAGSSNGTIGSSRYLAGIPFTFLRIPIIRNEAIPNSYGLASKYFKACTYIYKIPAN